MRDFLRAWWRIYRVVALIVMGLVLLIAPAVVLANYAEAHGEDPALIALAVLLWILAVVCGLVAASDSRVP